MEKRLTFLMIVLRKTLENGFSQQYIKANFPFYPDLHLQTSPLILSKNLKKYSLWNWIQISTAIERIEDLFYQFTCRYWRSSMVLIFAGLLEMRSHFIDIVEIADWRCCQADLDKAQQTCEQKQENCELHFEIDCTNDYSLLLTDTLDF